MCCNAARSIIVSESRIRFSNRIVRVIVKFSHKTDHCLGMRFFQYYNNYVYLRYLITPVELSAIKYLYIYLPGQHALHGITCRLTERGIISRGKRKNIGHRQRPHYKLLMSPNARCDGLLRRSITAG